MCCSAMPLRSVAQKCFFPEVLLRSCFSLMCVQKFCRSACGSEVSRRGVVSSVAQEYPSDALLGIVAQSVAQNCPSKLSLRYVCRNAARTVAQECRSVASLTCVCNSIVWSVAQKSRLCV